jgi:hypothetical protein
MPRRKRKFDANAIQLAARQTAESTAYIYRLPNELLHMIFNFLFLSGPDYWARPRETPVHVVRWVCAWFRQVASHHKFWLHERNANLAWIPLDPSGIRIYLGDDVLRKWLRHKTTWEFTHVEDFVAVMEIGGSSLVHNMRRVTFEGVGDEDISIAIRGLNDFTSLTYLCIWRPSGDPCTLDLDAIASSCPLIEEALLCQVGKFSGSLASLQHVVRFRFDFNLIPDEGASYSLSSVLPFNSADRLTHIEFELWDPLPKLYDESTLSPLDSFSNLTDIIIYDAIPEGVGLITNASISLLNVTISTKPHGIVDGPLCRMLLAPSLKLLRELTIHVTQFQTSPIWALANLECLKCLDIGGQFQRAWWSEFAALRELTLLVVAIDMREFDNKGADDEAEIKGNGDGAGIIESAIKRSWGKIFAHRDKMVRVVTKRETQGLVLWDQWF